MRMCIDDSHNGDTIHILSSGQLLFASSYKKQQDSTNLFFIARHQNQQRAVHTVFVYKLYGFEHVIEL